MIGIIIQKGGEVGVQIAPSLAEFTIEVIFSTRVENGELKSSVLAHAFQRDDQGRSVNPKWIDCDMEPGESYTVSLNEVTEPTLPVSVDGGSDSAGLELIENERYRYYLKLKEIYEKREGGGADG